MSDNRTTFGGRPTGGGRGMSGDLASLAIIGAGAYGSVIAELAEQCGFQIHQFLDDDPQKGGSTLDGVPVLVPVADHLDSLPGSTAIAVAIGSNEPRLHWLRQANRLGYSTPKLINPTAVVSPTAAIDEGVYLHSHSHVWTRAKISFGTILSPQATVAHHSTLGEGCFVSTGAHVGASISVGRSAFFGMGSTTSTGVTCVASRTVIGAGAVIIRDTQQGGVYVGSPGKLIRVNHDDK